MCDVCDQQDEEEKRLYERPEEGLADLINPHLGPLPSSMEFPDPAGLALLGGDRKRRALAFVTALVAMGLIIGLHQLWFGFAISPASGVLLGLLWLTNDAWWSLGVAMAVIIALFRFARPLRSAHKKMPYDGKFLDRAALYEELWFRAGAESWSWKKRIYSCATFGAVHITNIIYPLSALIVVGLMGGVFMGVYLREYKRSGDTQQATLAATHFHATFNRCAIILLAINLIVVVPIIVL